MKKKCETQTHKYRGQTSGYQWGEGKGEGQHGGGDEEAQTITYKIGYKGDSLAVQWLGLGAFIAVAWVRSLVGELRFHKLCSMAKKINE